MKNFVKSLSKLVSTPLGKRALIKYFGGLFGTCAGLWFLLDGFGEINLASVDAVLTDVMTPEELSDLNNRLHDYNEKRDLD